MTQNISERSKKSIKSNVEKVKLEEQLNDLKQALNFTRSNYLSPSNDASQKRGQYSVRLHHSNSIESCGNPSMAQSANIELDPCDKNSSVIKVQ